MCGWVVKIRKTEVYNLYVASLRYEYVSSLEISVNDIVPVAVIKGTYHLPCKTASHPLT